MPDTCFATMLHTTSLPPEVWCKSFSFILRGSRCVATLGRVNQIFRQLVCELSSWEGSAVSLHSEDILLVKGRARFESLIPRWRYCHGAAVDFEGAKAGLSRLAAETCFLSLTQGCHGISTLLVQNWWFFERSGLNVMRGAFPSLRHIELSRCDMLSSYAAVVPFFEEHPCLLSFKATFHPRAVADIGFAASIPPALLALGFINFEGPEVLAAVLEKASLKHLWFSATGTFSAEMANVLLTSSRRLQTLCLPTSTPADHIFGIVKVCPDLQLLCCMRNMFPAFGDAAFAAGFEPLEDCAVVMRRRGSHAQLAENGSLWSPHSWTGPRHTNRKLSTTMPLANAGLASGIASGTQGRTQLAVEASTMARPDATALAREAARVAAARYF